MGQILGGTGFPDTGLVCKVCTPFECLTVRHIQGEKQQSGKSSQSLQAQWGLEASEDTWDVLEGFAEGQTHTNWAKDGGKAVWAHPIDVHYQCMVRMCRSRNVCSRPCRSYSVQEWHDVTEGPE